MQKRERARVAVAALVMAVAAGAPASARADDCPNAAFRTGAGAALPDCMAWERMTPADKNGAAVRPDGPLLSAANGGGAFFQTSLPLQPDPPAFPYFVSYVASRSATGWGPPRATDVRNTQGGFAVNGKTVSVSDDLSGALAVSRAAVTPGAIERGSNLYLENTRTGAVSLVATKQSDVLDQSYGESLPAYGSTDFSTVVLSSTLALEDVASDARGPRRLYRFTGGALQRIATDVGDPQDPPSLLLGSAETHPVTADAARVTFTAEGSDGASSVYQYVDGVSRVVSQRNTQPGVAVDGSQPFASRDGTSVTYRSTARVAPGGPSGGPRLYRWSSATGTNVDLLAQTADLEARLPDDLTVRYVGEDGRMVWFTAGGKVQTFGSEDGGLFALDTSTGELQEVRVGETGRDVRGTVTATFSPLGYTAAIIAATQAAEGTVRDDVYAFVAVTPEGQTDRGAFCATCGSQRGGPIFVRIGTPDQFGGLRSTAALDDGRIFFDTNAPLSRADGDSLNDVYQYSQYLDRTVGPDGNPLPRLLTGTTAPGAAILGGITPDGRELYVQGPAPLVAADDDGVSDVYVARVGGGLADQQVAPTPPSACSGEACLPAASPVGPVAGGPPTAGEVPGPPPTLPQFSVATPSKSALRAAARTGRLTLRVRVGQAGTVSAGLRATVSSRARTVASRTVRTTDARTVTVPLRLSRAARRALARRGRLTSRLTVAYSERTDRIRRTLRLTTTGKGGRR